MMKNKTPKDNHSCHYSTNCYDIINYEFFFIYKAWNSELVCVLLSF